METNSLKIKFEGADEIELETLSSCLYATVNTLASIADATLGKNDYCKFKVKNIEKGSFVINIQQILDLGANLFFTGPKILEALMDYVEFRKFLRGELPKEIKHYEDTVQVKNNSGQIFQMNKPTFNIYIGNEAIENNLAKVAQFISKDDERTGLTYTTESKKKDKKVHLSKDDLRVLSKPLDVKSLDERITIDEVKTEVIVRKPDLIGDSKWQFVYRGKSIWAEVADESFIAKVKNNEIKFDSETVLKVKMEIQYKDNTVLGYKIIKVLKINNQDQ